MSVMSISDTEVVATIAIPVSIDAEIERLVLRLERGFEVIETARTAGEFVSEWEDAWIRLLRRYEALMDQRAA